MNAVERQNAIIEVLSRERRELVENLAERFGVSTRTIRRDILTLSCTYPVKTVRGRHGGGVYVEDWFHLNRKTLSVQQTALLRKLLPTLTGADQQIMQSILAQFGPGGLL